MTSRPPTSSSARWSRRSNRTSWRSPRSSPPCPRLGHRVRRGRQEARRLRPGRDRGMVRLDDDLRITSATVACVSVGPSRWSSTSPRPAATGRGDGRLGRGGAGRAGSRGPGRPTSTRPPTTAALAGVLAEQALSLQRGRGKRDRVHDDHVDRQRDDPAGRGAGAAAAVGLPAARLGLTDRRRLRARGLRAPHGAAGR